MRTGNLRFRFLEENNAYKNNTRIYYRYSIEATATNVAGETQSSADVIAAGNRSLILQTELKEKTCKNQPFNTVFKVQNLNGQPVEVKVHSPSIRRKMRTSSNWTRIRLQQVHLLPTKK